jgi:putative nucleotidyltransferase with HDIG domain
MAHKPTYEELEQRVKELEIQVQQQTVKLAEAHKVLQKVMAERKKGSMVENIISSFQRGEIALPSLPQINTKFNEMVSKGANLQEVGDILKKDAAISSKLIGVANSVYYQGETETKNLGHAISRLGLDTTKHYVDAICNRTLYTTSNKKFVEFMEKLWEHSLSCAYASETVSEAIKVKLQDDAFTLGLLHDIGKLVLLQIVAELETNGKLGEDVDRVELLNALDTHHSKIGAALLKKWEFPSGYIQIAMYHDNLEEADPISKELLVVHFANSLVKSMGYDQAQQAEVDVQDAESTRLLRLDSTMIAHVKEQVKGRMDELKDIL